MLLIWPVMTHSPKKALTCREVSEDGNNMQIKEQNRDVNAEVPSENNRPL